MEKRQIKFNAVNTRGEAVASVIAENPEEARRALEAILEKEVEEAKAKGNDWVIEWKQGNLISWKQNGRKVLAGHACNLEVHQLTHKKNTEVIMDLVKGNMPEGFAKKMTLEWLQQLHSNADLIEHITREYEKNWGCK